MVMMRTYDTEDGKTITTDSATYFVNIEVEQTPAYKKNTLFVIGLPEAEEIIKYAYKYDCTNVYFGTGTTFNPEDTEDYKDWNIVMCDVLDEGFWVTLDFDLIPYGPAVKVMGCNEYDRFIPMLSIKTPDLLGWNYNATVKLDDTDFRKSNPGVWCHRLHNLLDTEKFTDWSEYKGDTFVK